MTLKPEPLTPMSLYKIESELQELGQLLEVAIEEGDEAGAAAISVQMSRYLTAEVAKVDSYHGFIKGTTKLIEQVKAEEERLRRVRKAWEGAIERVKSMGVFVLQQLGRKRLEGSHGRRLRLHPSPVSVEVTDAAAVPAEFITTTVTMPLDFYEKLRDLYPDGMFKKVSAEVSLSRIKVFIEARQVCPECEGGGQIGRPIRTSPEASYTTAEWSTCPRCEGKGRIPGDVPGARLVTNNVHLRVE